MKKTLLSICIITVLGLTANAQWVQIGNDIEGDTVNERLGFSVSLSDDGSIMAIGAITNNDGGIGAGQVSIYENNGGNWTQVGDHINGVDPDDQFGHSISLNGSGNRVAISSRRHTGINGAFSGHVRVYDNIANVWTQVGDDINGEAFADESGSAVDLSSDGSILAVGAINNDGANGLNSGHVRVYMDSSGTWVQIGGDIDGEGNIDGSGEALCLSSDGTILAIGAREPTGYTGHVRIFSFDNDVWTQVGANIAGEAIGDNSGVSVSLSSDGSVVAIGAFLNDGINGPGSGHVRVYENISSVWTQVGDDIDGATSGDGSGISVSLSSDGSIVAIGARGYGGNPIDVGQTRVYQNISGVWTQVLNDINGVLASERSGFAVNLSADGSIVAIGAHENSGNGNNSGVVRVFSAGSIGIPEIDLLGISVHPNPTTGLIQVAFDATERNLAVNIYNPIGALIHTEQLSSISSFQYELPEAKGLYLIQFVTEKGEVRTARITKE